MHKKLRKEKLKYDMSNMINTYPNDNARFTELHKICAERRKQEQTLKSRKELVPRIEREIGEIERKIAKNNDIVKKPIPKYKMHVYFNIKDFNTSVAGGIIGVLAVASMFVSGYLYNSADISILKSYPILLIASALIGVFITLLGPVSIELLDELIHYKSYKKSAQRNREEEKKRAEEFMSNLDSHYAEIEQKRRQIEDTKREIMALENILRKPLNLNVDIRIPEELKSYEGILVLGRYISSGRAYTVQEAVNLYFNDAAQQKMLREAQMQTAYAQLQAAYAEEQAENTRVIAENSERAVELARQTAASARRAANAADTLVTYEHLERIERASK